MKQEKSKYQELQDHISYHLDRHLEDEELKEIIYHAIRCQDATEHVGIRKQRIEFNEREKAFYEEWVYENIPVAGLNHGNGILQDLFIDSGSSPIQSAKVEVSITSRDRMIVATVIQWLGSNVGMSFLEKALNKCGHKIVSK